MTICPQYCTFFHIFFSQKILSFYAGPLASCRPHPAAGLYSHSLIIIEKHTKLGEYLNIIAACLYNIIHSTVRINVHAA